MTVSVVIPACEAQGTIVRAIESLRRQTEPRWEAIVVADDLFDYAAFLSARMGVEPRLKFASTGRNRSGCHAARNAGFPLATGDFVTQLDADDEVAPDRFGTLRPLAARYGASADNLAIVDDATGALLSRPLGDLATDAILDLTAFMTLNAPLVPLIRRDHVLSRAPGVELSEDVIANIQLIDRIGALPVKAAASYVYRVRTGSIAHSDDSARRFEEAYSGYIERLEAGDAFGVSARNKRTAREGLTAKRALNRAFGEAHTRDPSLTFQAFIAGRPSPVFRPLAQV